MNRASILLAATFICTLVFSPAASAEVVVITQAKALAGNVTPGDAPGFPVTIDAAGSYALGSNLDVSAGADGIDVTSVDATIDFRGFTLNGGGVALNGVYALKRNFTIRNGTIRAFKRDGVRTASTLPLVERMRITENAGRGVSIAGLVGTGGFARIVGNEIYLNGSYGISCIDMCHVQGNLITNNGSSGVLLRGGSVLGNTIIENGSGGINATSATGYGNNTIAGNGVGPVIGTGPAVSFKSNVCGTSFC